MGHDVFKQINRTKDKAEQREKLKPIFRYTDEEFFHFEVSFAVKVCVGVEGALKLPVISLPFRVPDHIAVP